MRVIIAGGRDFNDWLLLQYKCDHYILSGHLPEEVTVISGAAKGADTLGARWGYIHGCHVRQFPADWNKYGKGAGHIRNKEMAENATHLIAFWDGHSRGTKNMIETARKLGLKVRVVNYDQ